MGPLHVAMGDVYIRWKNLFSWRLGRLSVMLPPDVVLPSHDTVSPDIRGWLASIQGDLHA